MFKFKFFRKVCAEFMDGGGLGGVVTTGEKMAATFGGFVPIGFAAFSSDKCVEAEGSGFTEETLTATSDHAYFLDVFVAARAVYYLMLKGCLAARAELLCAHWFGGCAPESDVLSFIIGKTTADRDAKEV